MKIPDHINPDHLLRQEEFHRIIRTLPSSVDRNLLMSHAVVSAAIVQAFRDLDEAAPTNTPIEQPWGVVDASGTLVGGYASRSKARKACDSSLGQRVKDFRSN